MSVPPALSWAATWTAGLMVTPADAVLGVATKATCVAGPPQLEPPLTFAPA
ncbi:MAG TPA: hypothetical protein VEO73_11160 [Gemmatimonadales bacterium]|nr:hypothetical protein [Gemmatimonadales bacterium]